MRLPNIQSRLDRLTLVQIICILVFLGLLTYANAVNHPFVHDDIVFIPLNPNITELDLTNLFFRFPAPEGQFTLVNQYYRPLLELTNRLLYRIIHLNPHGYHFFNILVHIINAVLVYKILFFLTQHRKKLCLAGAVLFLVHPIQSEAVACVSGISNLLFALLCLSSFYTYTCFDCAKATSHKKCFYILALVLFALALFAKEQSIVLPFLIMAYEICYTSRMKDTIQKKFWYIAGFLFILAGYFMIRKWQFGFAVTPQGMGGAEYVKILLAIPRSILTYLSLIFFPAQLHYYRSQDILLPYQGPLLLLLAVIVLVILIVRRMRAPEKKWMMLGISWFGIALLPTLNIAPLINEYSKILTSEHFVYFPIIGIILFLIGSGSALAQHMGEEKVFPGGFVLAVLIVVLFMGMTMKQNSYWRGEIPLFERTLAFQNDFGRVRFLLAKAYLAEGRVQESIKEGEKALAIMKGYEQKVRKNEIKEFYLGFIKQIHYHLGFSYNLSGEGVRSLAHFMAAAELDPENEIYNYSAGLACIQNRDAVKAAQYFERVVALNQNNLMAMNNLAICYQDMGEWDQAEMYLRKIVDKDPQSASAKRNLELLLRKRAELGEHL